MKALDDLVARGESFDYIFIETSGMADPGPVATIFWVDEQQESNLCLDSIVTFVDAKHCSLIETDGETLITAQRQVAIADLVVVNKLDLVSETELAAVNAAVTAVNKTAKQFHASYSKLSLDVILNARCYTPERGINEDYSSVQHKKHEHEHEHEHECESGCVTEAHTHSPTIRPIVLQFNGHVNLQKFNLWIGSLLWETPSALVLRCKGVLSVKGDGCKYSLQGVRELFQVEATNVSWGDEDRVSKVLLIGQGLDEPALAAAFAECKE